VNAPDAAELLNLVGFATGTVLYAMLLALALREPRAAGGDRRDLLPLATALLGLTWNLGELASYMWPRLGAGSEAWLSAVTFSALGVLAAVVVHSVARGLPQGWWLTTAAYVGAASAAALHTASVVTGSSAATAAGFTLLTACFGVIIVPLAWLTRRQPNGQRALWMLALALFAVSANHLGRVHGGDHGVLAELVGHHAAIPLAFAILYQHYRFALADLFLKRALALLALVVLAAGGYSLMATLPAGEPVAAGGLLLLWVATALVYPWMSRQIARFVDGVLLGRADYRALRAEIAREVVSEDTVEGVLDSVAARLAPALSARRVWWTQHGQPATAPGKITASILVPTTDAPSWELRIGDLDGGRRLLSDDVAMLEAVALVAARRIDAVRLTHERCERRLREEEMHKLTAEAELRALRAQINPHFLFNALTTISYLIETTPSRAVETLLRLTALLRGVLKSDGEFTTLGRELELVEHYLDIERERFEERLRVTFDIPASLRSLRIPSLVLQPLVENAIKHGVAPSAVGGAVAITGRLDVLPNGTALRLTVENTGARIDPDRLEGGGNGVGMRNVEQRLAGHYGEQARLTLRVSRAGTAVAEVVLPLVSAEAGGHRAADREAAVAE
jgi:two-component system, LytTR family, sensor kinase